MIFIARPITTFSILSWFKVPIKQQLFISWVGIRGAASIVFAIFAVTYGVPINYDIFHIIFFMALFSVAVQGTLIPTIARKLDLIDDEDSVFKTFNDYKEDKSTTLTEVSVEEKSGLINKSIKDADIPDDVLIVMIKRKEQVLIPKGSTIIKTGDILVLSGDRIEELIQL